MFIPRFETSNKGIKQRKRSKLEVERAATTAQWIRLRLSSCGPRVRIPSATSTLFKIHILIVFEKNIQKAIFLKKMIKLSDCVLKVLPAS